MSHNAPSQAINQLNVPVNSQFNRAVNTSSEKPHQFDRPVKTEFDRPISMPPPVNLPPQMPQIPQMPQKVANIPTYIPAQNK